MKAALIDGLQWLRKDISNTVFQGFVLVNLIFSYLKIQNLDDEMEHSLNLQTI